VANSPSSRSRWDAGISGMLASYGRGQPEPLAAWISWILTLRAQLTGLRAAPGTGLQSAGGGPSWAPTAQQARQVSVALMFHVPGWRKVTPQSAVPFAPVRATAPGLGRAAYGAPWYAGTLVAWPQSLS